MTTKLSRPLRADAASNVNRILRAARETFADQGPGASLDEIAARAGVGIATLYRRFPSRIDLVRAALEQSMADDFAPVTEQALKEQDPRTGLATLLNAAVAMAARERNTLAAAHDVGALTAELHSPFLDALALLMDRGQRAGVIRADLVPADLHLVMGMLVGTLWTLAPEEEGWRRYVALLLDSVFLVEAAPLPPLPRVHPASEKPVEPGRTTPGR